MSDGRCDIEIYVAAPAARIVAWLNRRFSWPVALAPLRRGGMATHRGVLRAVAGGAEAAQAARDEPAIEVPVLIVDDIAEGYASVLFDAPVTPWIDDLACAQEVAAALDCEVRCVDGSWQPDQAEDAGWLSVSPTGVRAIRWKPE